MADARDFERKLTLIERSIRELEATADAGLRATAQSLVQAVMDLHGVSLERLLAVVRQAGPAGDEIVDRLGRDMQVSSLLVLYGLHPADLPTRVARGIEQAQSALQAKGGEVALAGIDAAGVVRVRVRAGGSEQGCGSNGASLDQIVDDAIRAAAPDAAAIVIEREPAVAARAAAVPLVLMDKQGRPRERQPALPVAEGLPAGQG